MDSGALQQYSHFRMHRIGGYCSKNRHCVLLYDPYDNLTSSMTSCTTAFEGLPVLRR